MDGHTVCGVKNRKRTQLKFFFFFLGMGSQIAERVACCAVLANIVSPTLLQIGSHAKKNNQTQHNNHAITLEEYGFAHDFHHQLSPVQYSQFFPILFIHQQAQKLMEI